MPLDIATIPPTGQTLRYVRASYDRDRDGGDVGLISIPSQKVPPGVLMLGPSLLVSTPFTTGGDAQVSLWLGTQQLRNPIGAALVQTVGGLDTSIGQSPVDGSYPITLLVETDPLTAGAMLIYLWYV